jgi:signal transduction histidine kinase
LSQTVSRIGSEDLSGRLPEGRYHDEISRLSATFNRMLDRIQSSVNQLRVLTDSIAHDLKSPVTSIRGTLEVALSAGESGNWRDRVGEAVDGLDRLTKVLNTALDLAEADAGALVLRKEPVDITEIIEQLVDLYRPALAERKHQIVTTLQPLLVDADVSLLTRMLTNLLDNEIAHLPPGCRVSIDVRAREAEAEIVVADNGPGFPPDLRNRAFERFVKGEHSTGHGLGLAFVDAVVQAHGGHVLLTDHPGTGGAEIVLRMPLLEVLAEKA